MLIKLLIFYTIKMIEGIKKYIKKNVIPIALIAPPVVFSAFMLGKSLLNPPADFNLSFYAEKDRAVVNAFYDPPKFFLENIILNKVSVDVSAKYNGKTELLYQGKVWSKYGYVLPDLSDLLESVNIIKTYRKDPEDPSPAIVYVPEEIKEVEITYKIDPDNLLPEKNEKDNTVILNFSRNDLEKLASSIQSGLIGTSKMQQESRNIEIK